MHTLLKTLAIMAVATGAAPLGAGEAPLTFTVRLEVAKQDLTPDFCWFHPRLAAVPGAGANGGTAVIMTIQKHLKVSDYYSGMWVMRTDDRGATWHGPTAIPELGWVRHGDDVVTAAVSATESWVTVSEYRRETRRHARGADGSTFVARVIWSRPNKLVAGK